MAEVSRPSGAQRYLEASPGYRCPSHLGGRGPSSCIPRLPVRLMLLVGGSPFQAGVWATHQKYEKQTVPPEPSAPSCPA